VIPTLPPEAALAEEQREEARRQAEANGGAAVEAAADGAELAADLVGSGMLEAVGDIAGACLDGAATVAQASVEVIGGLLGGLADL
jgi:hypothetical protein